MMNRKKHLMIDFNSMKTYVVYFMSKVEVTTFLYNHFDNF